MYAGSSGMVNGANTMLVQIGDKLQGLPPTTNKPARLINHITTKAEGDKRDYIFCINQLAGGVGKGKGQFAVGADGVKDCTTGKYKPKVNCDFIRLGALQTWVQTELSSLYATIAQGASVSSSESWPEKYVGLAIVSEEMLSNGSLFKRDGALDSTGTITSFLTDISKFKNGNTFLNHVNTIGGIPNTDLVTFNANGSSAPVTSTNLNADVNGFLTSAQLNDFATALDNSLSANPDVKATLESIANKNIKVDGVSCNHKIVATIFTEQFVQSPLFTNMLQWYTNASGNGNRSGSSIWFEYDANPAFNGFVNAINNQQILYSNQHYRTNFTFLCDIDSITIPGASICITDGHIHTNNVFPSTNSISSISLGMWFSD